MYILISTSTSAQLLFFIKITSLCHQLSYTQRRSTVNKLSTSSINLYDNRENVRQPNKTGGRSSRFEKCYDHLQVNR